MFDSTEVPGATEAATGVVVAPALAPTPAASPTRLDLLGSPELESSLKMSSTADQRQTKLTSDQRQTKLMSGKQNFVRR